jgi:type II secretory pathway component PulM
MASAIAEMKHEWRQFRHDEPGERFCNHRQRMQHKSRKHAAVSLALGVLLLAAGTVLLFIPGPGIPLIVFGLALVATHSRRLSLLLDRGEPALRRVGHRIAHRWKAMPKRHKATVVVGGLVVVSAFLMAIWKWVVVA